MNHLDIVPLHCNEQKQETQAVRPSPSAQRNFNPELEFQKNYPKNVFIPLIEYLAEKGYKQAYEECVGTREQIERKNVVSLDMIFNLTRQAWFQRNINKNEILTNISNKILMNSKIKKKLFHLLIAQYLLLQDKSVQIKQFKKNISKMANTIAAENLPSDELFSYPNSIIYLLTMFLRIFRQSLESKGIQKLDEEFNNLKIDQSAPEGAKSKNIGSKEQYKYLVKQIVQLFGKRNLTMNELTDAFQEIKNTILDRATLIRQRYHLINTIPNWQIFVEVVVTRCFQIRRKDGKITNMTFNEWINQYKNRSVCAHQKGQAMVPMNSTGFQVYVSQSYDSNIDKEKKAGFRTFSPIILTKNY